MSDKHLQESPVNCKMKPNASNKAANKQVNFRESSGGVLALQECEAPSLNGSFPSRMSNTSQRTVKKEVLEQIRQKMVEKHGSQAISVIEMHIQELTKKGKVTLKVSVS